MAPRLPWWVERVMQAVPALNHRVLSLTELTNYCFEKDWLFEEIPLRRLHGCCFTDGQPSLVVNSLLDPDRKLIAGWHEFTHALLHDDAISSFCSTGDFWLHSKPELQAQTIGTLALIPQQMLHELSNYPRDIAEFRWQIWKDFGL